MKNRHYPRGAVVKGPDLLGPHQYRPYVCLSTDTPPFRDEEAVYAVVTTTRRADAIALASDDFSSGSLPRESYVNPWVLVTINHADIQQREGQLEKEVVDEIAREAAAHIGAQHESPDRPPPRLKTRVCARTMYHNRHDPDISSNPHYQAIEPS